MQVRVKVQTTANLDGKPMKDGEAKMTIDLHATPNTTIGELKQKIPAANLLAFPVNLLLYREMPLLDDASLASCGIGQSATMELVVLASPDAVAQQLEKLLKTADLTIRELNMHYCHNFGVPVTYALSMCGLEQPLEEFLVSMPDRFCVESGCVTLVTDQDADTGEPQVDALKEAVEIAKQYAKPTMLIDDLARLFYSKLGIQMTDLTNQYPRAFLEQSGKFKMLPRGRVMLFEEIRRLRQQKEEALKQAPEEWSEESTAASSDAGEDRWSADWYGYSDNWWQWEDQRHQTYWPKQKDHKPQQQQQWQKKKTNEESEEQHPAEQAVVWRRRGKARFAVPQIPRGVWQVKVDA